MAALLFGKWSANLFTPKPSIFELNPPVHLDPKLHFTVARQSAKVQVESSGLFVYVWTSSAMRNRWCVKFLVLVCMKQFSGSTTLSSITKASWPFSMFVTQVGKVPVLWMRRTVWRRPVCGSKWRVRISAERTWELNGFGYFIQTANETVSHLCLQQKQIKLWAKLAKWN